MNTLDTTTLKPTDSYTRYEDMPIFQEKLAQLRTSDKFTKAIIWGIILFIVVYTLIELGLSIIDLID